MKKFKKVYIEITNGCNLNCSFCIGNKRKVQFMSLDEFKLILKKIRPYTDYLYFHILGEPLLHPNINEFIKYAISNGFYVNITTNGYLIDKIKCNGIRQINFSLHSFDEKYGINLINYLNNIFNYIDNLNNTYVSLRLWINSKYNGEILYYIAKRYKLPKIPSKFNNFKINDNVFLSQFHEFIWPDLNNNYVKEEGSCYGLRDHIGILVDGTVIPCCLDSLGTINLGNILTDNLDEILNSKRVINMINNFKNNRKCEKLCQHCNFLDN